MGIVLMVAAADITVHCLKKVARGTRCLSRELIDPLVERVPKHRQNVCKFEIMTMREREIALLVAEELSNKEIARHFHMSALICFRARTCP